MRVIINRRIAALALFSLVLSACGGGSSSPPAPPAPTVPTVTLSANPTSVTVGSSTNLTWTSTDATSCTASGGWSGSRTTGSSEVSSALTANTTFNLSCTGAGGTANASVSVTATVPLPAISLTATPATIATGGSSTLNWTVLNATSCTTSGAWSGSRPTTGTQSTGTLNATASYTLTCTGAGGSNASTVSVNVVNNNAPTANAGADRIANMGSVVTLVGAASSDSDGTIASYAWSQTAGPIVTLNRSGSDASFTAPNVAADTILTFQLVVTDNLGTASAPDLVNVTVKPLTAGQTPISGRITFARIPVSTAGWNYASTVQQAARGITVELVNATSGSVITSGATDGDGFYSLIATPNTSVFVRARAEIIKTGSGPTWNVRVQDVDNANTLQTARGADFNSGTGVTHDVAIQSGWDPVTRVQSGPRAAGPFAILDTMYRAIGKVTALSPTINFPALIVDWAENNTGGQTFFTSGVSGNDPKIVLSGQINNDTDEYDQHVIAHEFGHYVEWRFGRSDSIGGPHGAGDRLDPRLAWGEGFGYWFACFVMDDPLAIDTLGASQLQAGRFNVENNAVAISNPGWWSEASSFSILWDIYDAANDDGIALGAAPMWAVLTGPMRSAESMTTIFTFIAALKQANAGAAAQIDTLVSSHGLLAATLDEFASTETSNAGSNNVLPLYTNVAAGGSAVTLQSIQDFGTPNKLGNYRFLKLTVPGPRTVRITATTAVGRDPDVFVYRRGLTVAAGETTANEDFNATLAEAGTYVIEVYDCNNAGCAGGSPAPASTPITVQVQ